MLASTEKYDLIELKSVSARLDKGNLPEYCLIYSWVDSKLMDTGICLHITEIKELQKYGNYRTVPLILLDEPMNFFEEYGFLRIQKLTAIWQIKENKLKG